MARKITYAIDAALNFKILGFATGAYNCTCSICKEKFVGDKRAFQCLRCAIESVESKLQSAPPINNAMNAISLKAKAFVPKVKNGMDSWTIHNIRDILTTVAETAS